MSLSTDYSTSASQANNNKINAEDINLQHINADARAVLEFWFAKDNEPYWFEKNEDFDQLINFVPFDFITVFAEYLYAAILINFEA